MWDRGRRRVQQAVVKPKQTIGELFIELTRRLDEMERQDKEISQWRDPLQSLQERARRFGDELGLVIGFCELPGCGVPFSKPMPHARFHSSECKTTWDNKYRKKEAAARKAAEAAANAEPVGQP
jgi:hypothetical protein